MKNLTLNLTLISAACALTSGLTFAATQEPESADTVEKISVVGAASNLVITAEDLEQFQANDLADIFRTTPSVAVGGSVGVAQKIYIRGLEDSYLNVTVDGAQQTSTLFHHVGRVTLDPDLLKQIDVQAGAGEATSGPGAIGGSISFKTKDAQDLLSDDEQFGGRVKANYFSNNGTRLSGSVYGKVSDDWGLLGYYSTINRDNMENGDGEEILGSAADQDLLFLKGSGTIGEHHYLSFSVEQRDEEGEFSARPNWMVAEGAALYASEAERETYVANYAFDYDNAVYLEATVYQTNSSFSGGRFAWLADIDTFGLDIRNTTELANHKFVYGVDYRSDEVESGSVGGPVENREEGTVLGVYGQGHSDLTSDLLVSYGVRLDKYTFDQSILLEEYYGDLVTAEAVSLDDNEVSFNLGALYTLNDKWALGLGYAQAARGKEIGDGFTIDGVLWKGLPVVNQDLVPETVANIEASIEYSDDNLNAKLTVFNSTIDDVISADFNGDAIYTNIGELDTAGFEFDLAYQVGDIDLFLGYSSVSTELAPRDDLYSNASYSSIDINGYEFDGLGNSRGDTWLLGADYNVTDDLSIGASINHVNSLSIDTLHGALEAGWTDAIYRLTKPAYTTVDAYLDFQVASNFKVNLVVTNLLNEQYIDHSSVADYSEVFGSVVGPDEAGRDIRVSVTFDF
ncbi:MAG: TonB-dependent receptor [Paraglaciecola sp.]|uniref:TonB-dependent receptor plug domain-containing protein n=1 Tax=Paraglaciecola sp. TaxID=1920173 RepID=UPI003299FD5E